MNGDVAANEVSSPVDSGARVTSVRASVIDDGEPQTVTQDRRQVHVDVAVDMGASSAWSGRVDHAERLV